MHEASLTRLVQYFADLIAESVVRTLRNNPSEMLDQAASPVGRRRHIGIVRKMVAKGVPGAMIDGRRYLITRELLQQAMSATQTKQSTTQTESAFSKKYRKRSAGDEEIDHMLRSVGMKRVEK